MKLIVGLGNPGSKYARTLHNMGFMTLEMLCSKLNAPLKKLECKALTAHVNIAGEKVIIAAPQTFMNLSGESVIGLMNKYKIALSDVLVIYDDIDLPIASLRIRKSGSGGTHNGMRNILALVPSDGFPRIRIGVGRPPEGWVLADYVLSRVRKEDETAVFAALTKAAEAAERFCQGESLDAIMQEYNN